MLIWQAQLLAEDPTNFRKVAREFHRMIQRTNVHTRRKGSEADIVYLDTNYRCMLAFSTRENVDLEAMRLRVRAKLREIGKRLAVVAYLGKPNLWKLYLIPEIEKEGGE